jgi:hypothetical protein
MIPITISQLRTTATVDLMTAARALGLGRTKAYELARRDQFPCRVIRIGETYRIPTAGLLELLGVSPEQRPASTTPAHLTNPPDPRARPAGRHDQPPARIPR